MMGALPFFWKPVLYLAIFLFIAIALVGASKLGPMESHAVSLVNVDIVDYAFMPLHLNITTGTEVIWTYVLTGHDRHTVSSSNSSQSGPLFASGLLNPGQSFNHTFYNPGFYPYFCAVHPTIASMNGWVNATGSPVTPPSSTMPSGGQPSPFVELGLVVAAVVLTASALFYVRVRRKRSSEGVRV